MPGMSAIEAAVALIDRTCIDEIRYIERATGRSDVLSGFVAMLERNIAAFPAAFGDCLARGDAAGAARAAHTLKGACRQLGAQALGDLFAQIESCAKAGDYADARRRFESGAALVAQSLEALRQA
jgi:HPt (histidine-containing phosphotransfer) domain-containing protein